MTLRLAVNAVPLRSSLSGVGQYVRHLMAAIAARGDVDIRYFFGTHWGRRSVVSPLPLEDAAKRAIKRALPLPHVLMRALQRPVFAAGVWSFRPQVYHEPNFVSLPFGGPTVLTVHDLSFVHFPETHPMDRLRHLDRYLASTLAHAAHVITDSQEVRKETIEHFALDPARVTAIHLGVDGAFAPRGEAHCREVLTRYGLRYGRYGLSVGTLEPRKNLIAVIQAYAALPQSLRDRAPLVIAGRRGWLSDDIDKRICAGEAAGWVRFLGYVPQTDLPIIYAGASVFAYPSRYEGFGLPVLEAMASGIPVVTSSVSCLPEVAGGAADLVHPDDVDGLGAVLARLLEDESHRMELRTLGLEWARNFSWQRCAENTVGVYRAVAGT